MDASGEFIFQKLVTNQLFGLEFSTVLWDTIHPNQDYEQVNFYKNRVFISFVGPSETGKLQLNYSWLKSGTFQPKFDEMYFFLSTFPTSLQCYAKKLENLEFEQGVNFEFIDLLKTNSTKYFLIFDVSCEKICSSKAFVDITTAGNIGVWAQSTLNTTFIFRAN